MKNILVPVNFSELSDFAFDLAKKISLASGAKINLLNVVEAPGDTLFDKNGNLLDCSEYDVTALKKDAAQAEIKLQEWLKTKNSEAPGKVKIGHWYELILDEAVKCDCDLIVMGAEYTTGIKENIKATVADRIVRKSPVPVMTLKCDRGDMTLKKIALAGDFRAPAIAEVESLQLLQKSFEAELHLIKINTEKDFETQRQILERMQKFSELNNLNVKEYHVYCDRTVEQGIVNFCDDMEIDLLAIGKHDRSDLSHLFRGSKAEDIVNHVFKPILTFKI